MAAASPSPAPGERHDRLTARCPRCGLGLTARPLTLPPQHCPRCWAKHHVAVELKPAGEAAIGIWTRAPRV